MLNSAYFFVVFCFARYAIFNSRFNLTKRLFCDIINVYFIETTENIMKRISALVLVILMLAAALPFTSNAVLTTGDIESKMDYYKDNVYQNGTYWCGGNVNASISYSACGRKYDCTCNVFAGGSQCHGFALCLANKVIGSYPAGSLASYYNGKHSNGWTCYTKSALGTGGICALGLQPGDIIRAADDSSFASGHTAIVWKVSGSTVYFAECWGSVYCKLNWGGFNYRSYSMSDICSRYAYVALWRNDSVISGGTASCRHSYVQKFETKHPHAGYMECSKCGDRYYNDTSTAVTGCVCCQGTHSYVTSYENSHPHAEVKTCSICGDIIYTGKNHKDPNCKYCNAVPSSLSIKIDKSSYSVGDTVILYVSANDCTYSQIEVYRDGAVDKIIDSTGKSTAVFVTEETGSYYARLICSNENGTAAPVTSDHFTVSSVLAAVASDETHAYCLYLNPMQESSIHTFCSERGGSLARYDAAKALIDTLVSKYPEYRFAMTDAGGKLCYIGKGNSYGGFVLSLSLNGIITGSDTSRAHKYTVYPFSLPYNEARAFAKSLDMSLVSITDAKKNSAVAALVDKADLHGVFIGASDEKREGTWVWENGESFGYTNWNLAYTGYSDTSANYLYMYRDGTWIDSSLTPGKASGFVCEYYTPFEFSAVSGGYALTAYLDTLDTIVIPAEYNGKKVIAIGKNAFSGKNVKTVTVPASVTQIDENAFHGCSQFTIVCEKNSAAYDFALSQNIKYSIIMPFIDVPSGSWFADAVSFCYGRDIMSGTSQTAFSPSGNITRAMFVIILAKIAGADTSAYANASSFADVPTGTWYSAPVEWAYQNGYAAGSGAGFAPNAYLTREQLAVFLRSFTEHSGGDVSAQVDLSAYKDEDDIGAWARQGISWAVASGLISGTTPETVSPKMTATRAQAAVIIRNYLEK